MSERTCYLASAVNKKDYPITNLPELAMLGRSNVGKSSLINRLTNRKNMARTSGTPGKTRTINFYKVNNNFVLVDLPGYGYAKVSKKERERWQIMINEYLYGQESLKGLIQLVDIRHLPTELDIQMYAWLKERNLPYVIVATKSDKLKRGQRAKNLKLIRENLDPDLSPQQLLEFSAKSGEGKERIWQFLNNTIL